MDFALTETQDAIREMLKKLFGELVTDDSLKALERSGQLFHVKTWRALAQAQMLGIALPEAVGGAGLGLFELGLLLQQVGRSVAPIPALETLVMGALPVARFGTPDQQARLLPPIIAGDLFLTASLREPGSRLPDRPTTRALPDGDAWRLTGVRDCVSGLEGASAILIPAMIEGVGVTVFLLDPAAEGVQTQEQRSTSGERLALLTLDGARCGELLGQPGQGAQIARWIERWTTFGLCALALGVAERAMFMTADYAGQRHQFGAPLGSFQAVSQRMGDAYIDVEAMKVALWQAAFRLDSEPVRQELPSPRGPMTPISTRPMLDGPPGPPALVQADLDAIGLARLGPPLTERLSDQDPDRALAIAKFWAAEGCHRVLATAQHIHAGMGFDRDYPLHRYFLWARRIEFTLGGASAQLARLGDMIADEARAPGADPQP